MIIKHFQPLDDPISVHPCDEIRLSIDGKLVCATSIKNIKLITHWACVTMCGSIGYFVGGPELEWQLKELGFQYDNI